MLEQVNFNVDKMSKEEYKPKHKELVNKLVVLQQQARTKGIGLVVLFEGWGGAGKGSRISDLMYELDARATTVHVTEDFDVNAARNFAGAKWGVSDFQPVMQEFWSALGERGTITFYDRGWYTAAIDQALFELTRNVDKTSLKKTIGQKVRGYGAAEAGASKARGEFHGDVVASYQRIAHNFEQMLVDDGYTVIKLFVHVSKAAQKKRIKHLRENPNTAWRVSDEKIEQLKYYDQAYMLYDRLLEASNFAFAPWTLVNGEDKRAANLQVLQALIDAIEHALAAGPDAATEAAQKKASENSERAAAAIGDGGAEGPAASDEEAVRKAAEAEAALQHSQAPRGSNYIIMAGYPQINHGIEKPRIESDEEYKAQLKI